MAEKNDPKTDPKTTLTADDTAAKAQKALDEKDALVAKLLAEVKSLDEHASDLQKALDEKDAELKAKSTQQSSEEQRMNETVIARLKKQVGVLEDQVAAFEEIAQSDKAAKKALAEGRARGAKQAVAKVSMLGDGRRDIKPGDKITAAEQKGLTEGTHFHLVEI